MPATLDDDYERAGWAANLDPRPAERRYDETRDDRGIEPAVGGYAAGNGKRNRQRECDDTYDNPRHQIRGKLGAAVSAKRCNRFGDEHLALLTKEELLR
jgi:hypothetical protein